MIEKKGPALSKHINQFIQETQPVSVPNLTAFFKKGKKHSAEYSIEVKSEKETSIYSEEEEEEELESSGEMVLMITTLPALTAINRAVRLEKEGESLSETVYHSPRKIDLPIMSAYSKFITLNSQEETFGEPKQIEMELIAKELIYQTMDTVV